MVQTQSLETVLKCKAIEKLNLLWQFFMLLGKFSLLLLTKYRNLRGTIKFFLKNTTRFNLDIRPIGQK